MGPSNPYMIVQCNAERPIEMCGDKPLRLGYRLNGGDDNNKLPELIGCLGWAL